MAAETDERRSPEDVGVILKYGMEASGRVFEASIVQKRYGLKALAAGQNLKQCM
jgi:hypothetical protein